MTLASSTISNDAAITTNTDPKKCPDCLARFDFKTSIGPCGRCYKLNAEQDSEKLEKIKTFPMCKGCSACSDRLATEYCGDLKVAATEAGAEDNDLENLTTTAEMWRSQKSQARFQGKNRPKPTIPNMPTPYATPSQVPTPSQQPIQPSTPFVVPTSAPNDLSSRPSPGQSRSQSTKDPQVGFVARTMFNNKEVVKFGKVIDSSSFNVPMPDIIERILTRINKDWENISEENLSRHDVSVRLFGNMEPLEESMNHSIGTFYQMHSAHAQSTVYLKRDPKFKSVPGAFICFEIHINEQAYQSRTGRDIPALIGSSSNKRKNISASYTSSRVISQPTVSRIALNSRFQFNIPKLRNNNATSAIAFNIANGTINDRGNVNIDWDKDIQWNGHLCDSPFAKGKMKMAFEFTRNDGEQFAAKRFFNIGQGRDMPVELSDNANYLLHEYSNILRGNFWLGEFYDLADDENVEVSKTFSFTECYLACEVISVDGFASQASGAREKTLTDDDEVFWLIEPKRARAVDRWSGSMDHPNFLGKRHQTAMAFAHFTLEISKGSLVYVDLQSTPGVHSKTGLSTDILFDVGTHSNSNDKGLTGPGDFGREGIEAFEKQHKCLSICQKLSLVAFDVDEDEDTEPVSKKRRVSNGKNAESGDDSDA
ncbi:hypothetical protein K435DRAFT_973281 [Dendrothele bispora CBS 962.96]|uniref:Alpha-type protein kinase domain-containing protein n=1 Tax=Dendrothele bispora (strain CBS 962.96) TaxID=1314807 RepID=A0A4S8KTN7_DENBC|nr:hypothetical protein K435DRAFT_973281 [Dendrothele bispora CBS 962.96]